MIFICFLYGEIFFTRTAGTIYPVTIFTENQNQKLFRRKVEMAALPHLDFAPLLADESEDEEFDVFAAGKLLLFTLKIIHFNNKILLYK